MQVAIIHNPQRTDRNVAVMALVQRYPTAEIYTHVIPNINESPQAKQVRGCSLAHLRILTQLLSADEDVMIFEDDAVCFEEGINELNLDNIPEDAGVVLLGGETQNNIDVGNGWYKCLPKVWGTHAVIYRKSLFKTNFLAYAYDILSTHNAERWCLESIIFAAINRVELSIVRPRKMCFTTLPVVSDRDGQIQGRRDSTLII